MGIFKWRFESESYIGRPPRVVLCSDLSKAVQPRLAQVPFTDQARSTSHTTLHNFPPLQHYSSRNSNNRISGTVTVISERVEHIRDIRDKTRSRDHVFRSKIKFDILLYSVAARSRALSRSLTSSDLVTALSNSRYLELP